MRQTYTTHGTHMSWLGCTRADPCTVLHRTVAGVSCKARGSADASEATVGRVHHRLLQNQMRLHRVRRLYGPTSRAHGCGVQGLLPCGQLWLECQRRVMLVMVVGMGGGTVRGQPAGCRSREQGARDCPSAGLHGSRQPSSQRRRHLYRLLLPGLCSPGHFTPFQMR